MTGAGPKADLRRYLQADDDNLRAADQAWWKNFRSQLERVAQEASQGRALDERMIAS